MIELCQIIFVLDLVLIKQRKREIPDILCHSELKMLHVVASRCKRGTFENLSSEWLTTWRFYSVFVNEMARYRDVLITQTSPTECASDRGVDEINFACSIDTRSDSVTIIDNGRERDADEVDDESDAYEMQVTLKSSDSQTFKGVIVCAYKTEDFETNGAIANFTIPCSNPLFLHGSASNLQQNIRWYDAYKH
jgi:hypothetical protein